MTGIEKLWKFKDGLRHVIPYTHMYRTSCKGRWFGRTVYDVYCSEFKNQPPEYHAMKIKTGRMKLIKNPNSKKHFVEIQGDDLSNTLIETGDKIIHDEHIHETPIRDNLFNAETRQRDWSYIFDEPMYLNKPEPGGVTTSGCSIPIIFEDENLIVVDKPCGIPVHPTQGYFYNSITEILRQETIPSTSSSSLSDNESNKSFLPCHRIDKLTSGVLMIGKNNEAVSNIKKLMKSKSLEKEYIARVKGKFPLNIEYCQDNIVYIYAMKNIVKEYKNPLTYFKRLSYDPILNESTVHCKPVTGFPHQIRIHLRNLGYPISNDPLYSEGKIYDKIIKSRDEIIDGEQFIEDYVIKANSNRDLLDTNLKCQICSKSIYVDPQPSDIELYLHSLSYQYENNWRFKTPLPLWSRI
ncbi:unnamed protein product [[Candida] boidinii]|nr:unnamed protein product [[Candida] boidinii]